MRYFESDFLMLSSVDCTSFFHKGKASDVLWTSPAYGKDDPVLFHAISWHLVSMGLIHVDVKGTSSSKHLDLPPVNIALWEKRPGSTATPGLCEWYDVPLW